MKREIKFVSKKYDWGWSVWIQVDGKLMLIADKLENREAVNTFVKSISDSPIIYKKKGEKTSV